MLLLPYKNWICIASNKLKTDHFSGGKRSIENRWNKPWAGSYNKLFYCLRVFFYQGTSPPSIKNLPVGISLVNVASFTIGLTPSSTVFIPLNSFRSVAV